MKQHACPLCGELLPVHRPNCAVHARRRKTSLIWLALMVLLLCISVMLGFRAGGFI